MTATARFILLLIAVLLFLVGVVLSFIFAGSTTGPSLAHVLDVLGVYGVASIFFAAAHFGPVPVP